MVGYVRHDGLVHFLYEWNKAERVFWDSQCGLEWGHRDNVNLALKPRATSHRPTCFACIVYQISIPGVRWSPD